ncbi:hypothetical protein A2U01_0067076, partial [Trifolium medium]|nr:hypothetical protein [Trifolium medium]
SSAALGTPAMEYVEEMSSYAEKLLDGPDNPPKVTTRLLFPSLVLLPSLSHSLSHSVILA